MKQLTVSCLAWLLKGVCLILSTNSQGCLSSALVVNDSKWVRLKYDREEQSASSFSWREPDNISVLDMLQPVTFSQRAAFSILSLFQAMPINFTFSNVLSYRNKRPRNQLLLWHKKSHSYSVCWICSDFRSTLSFICCLNFSQNLFSTFWEVRSSWAWNRSTPKVHKNWSISIPFCGKPLKCPTSNYTLKARMSRNSIKL